MAFWQLPPGSGAARRGTFRPRVVPLEDRTVPTVATPLPPLAGADGDTTATTTTTPAVTTTSTTGDVTTTTGTGSTQTTPGGSTTTTTTIPGGGDTTTVTDNGDRVAYGADAGNAPMVRVYDTQGHLKKNFLAYDVQFKGGVRVATADVNNDGIEDLITAPGGNTRPLIKVFDGKTGDQIGSFLAYDQGFRGGVNVAAADVNGDGKADIITGADAGGGPHVKVFSGADLSGKTVLHSFFAYDPGFRGGVRVAAGDVDGDPGTEIVTAAGPGGGPHVLVFDGTTLAIKQSFFAYHPKATFGAYVAVGDLDGDGKGEIITGAGVRGATTVNVFSGTDGTLQKTFRVTDQTDLTSSVRVGVADIDGDGKDDLIASVKDTVTVYSGVNLLKKLTTSKPLQPTTIEGGLFIG